VCATSATATAMTASVRGRRLTPKRLRRGRWTRRPAMQERNVERWLRDRDRRELETRRRGRKRAELVGRRGESLIGIGARSHDLHGRRDRLAHRNGPIAKLVRELVGPDRVRCQERREQSPGRSDLEDPGGARSLLHG